MTCSPAPWHSGLTRPTCRHSPKGTYVSALSRLSCRRVAMAAFTRLRTELIREEIAHFGDDPPGGVPLGDALDVGVAILEALTEAIDCRSCGVRRQRHIR